MAESGMNNLQLGMRQGITQLRKQIMVLNGMIAKLQDECKHELATRVAKADTGNWCKEDDSYWYECKCPVCDKFWMEDQ